MQKSAYIFTDDEIRAKLVFYLRVPDKLWDLIPIGSHIRFIKVGPGPKNTRFMIGGFVKLHAVDASKRKFIMLETKPHGKTGDAGYFSYSIKYEEIVEIWKKYSRDSTVELELIMQSLEKKSREISELKAEISELKTENAKNTARMANLEKSIRK